MAYDGTIQFDVAMDADKFEQGISQILSFLETLQVEPFSEKIAAGLDMSEAAEGFGTLAGQSFAGGLAATGELAAAEAGEVAWKAGEALGILPQITADIIPQVFAGMGGQMDALAPALYQKATAIAEGILARLRKAFDIHSPSKKTQEIAHNVMLGLVEGMEEMSGTAYFAADEVAAGILNRLENSAEPGVLVLAQNRLHQAVRQNHPAVPDAGGAAFSPAFGKAEQQVNLGGLTQNFYSPTAPTPAEATQQGMAFLEQARWKLPQMTR